MASYLSWGANAVLIVTGCFVTANMANGIIAEWVAPPAVEQGPQEPTDGNTETRASSAAIVARNIFKSALQAPNESDEKVDYNEEGPLDETAIPVRLLGTVASDDPSVARAALEDTETRERLIVRVGDRIRDEATVYRIQRRRVVLAENDAMRELSLDDEPVEVAAASRRRPAVERRRATPRVARSEPKVSRTQVQETLRDPTTLFQQARFLPKYDDGQMQGYQLSGIKPGSLIEEMGIADGDVIVEANGIAIDSPTSGGQLFRQINEVDELTFMVKRADGSTEEIQVPFDD